MSEPNVPEANEPEIQPEKKTFVSAYEKADAEKIRRGIRPRTAKRLAIMSVILAVFLYGGYWFIGLKGDLQLHSDTSTMIAATRLLDQGSQAVVIDAQGKVTQSSGYVMGKSDRDLAWDPKGERLFFISDRKDDSFHIYRWDPQRDKVDQRSIDKAGRSNLTFDTQDKGNGELVGLVMVRGTVQKFTPKTAKSQQVMPPPKKANGDPEGGSTSAFDLIYKRYGDSFKVARWFNDRHYTAAVMRREDKGESLIIQNNDPDEKGDVRPPQILFVAQKINLAVDPKSGSLIFSITEVLPILKPDGTPVLGPDNKPPKYDFVHALFMLSITNTGPKAEFIGPSPGRDFCFGNPVVSPDGSAMMFQIGKYMGDGNMETQNLVSCPLTAGGIRGMSQVAPGTVTDQSYSPDGRKIAFVRQEGGHQAIFVAANDGSGAKNLTGSAGDFAAPVFSPQYK